MLTLLSVSCKDSSTLGTCTVMGLNGTLFEAKMFTFTWTNRRGNWNRRRNRRRENGNR
jgi:hypothetical protein